MIWRKRRYGARKRSVSAPAAITLSRRTNKGMQRSDEEMVAAINAVKSGMGVNRAAEQYMVPLTTLRGRVTPGTKPDPKLYLTQEEEKELGSFLKWCAEVGYGKTRMDVMHIIQRVATDQGLLKGNKLSSGWWRRFLERQPLRQGDSTAHVCMDALNEDTLKQYFSLLSDVMTEFDLHSKPTTTVPITSKVSLSPPTAALATTTALITEHSQKLYRSLTLQVAKLVQTPPRKRTCKQRETENEIDTDMCCVCCVLHSEDIYSSGSDWIECACG